MCFFIVLYSIIVSHSQLVSISSIIELLFLGDWKKNRKPAVKVRWGLGRVVSFVFGAVRWRVGIVSVLSRFSVGARTETGKQSWFWRSSITGHCDNCFSWWVRTQEEERAFYLRDNRSNKSNSGCKPGALWAQINHCNIDEIVEWSQLKTGSRIRERWKPSKELEVAVNQMLEPKEDKEAIHDGQSTTWKIGVQEK